MIESPLIEQWRAEGLHKGILAVLNYRFKAVPRVLTRKLQSILDQKKLTSLNVLASDCPNLDTFREALSE